MRLILKTDKRRYFRQVLELLSPVPPFSKTSSKERAVLGEFLYYNWMYQALPESEIKKILFSADNKEEVRIRLKMSKEALNVTMYTLRRKGFLTYDSIPKEYVIFPERILEYIFIEEEEKKNDIGSEVL